MNAIGIMQGRLSPRRPRLQSFPWATWREEFALARRLGFNRIEWLFEEENWENNPLWTDAGRIEIRGLVAESGVAVESICADYFSRRPFFRVEQSERHDSIRRLEDLIENAASIGARMILVPALESSDIRTDEEKRELVSALAGPCERARRNGMTLGLETELPAPQYLALVNEPGDSGVAVYYDVGNAKARGYDVPSDLRLLAGHLGGIHIKDRMRGGPNVPLGQGEVEWDEVFRVLLEIGYSSSLILETVVGADAAASARDNLAFVRTHLSRALEATPNPARATGA